jgi:hypothetical protein
MCIDELAAGSITLPEPLEARDSFPVGLSSTLRYQRQWSASMLAASHVIAVLAVGTIAAKRGLWF